MSASEPIRVLIVDDEPPAVERLSAMVSEMPGCRVVGCESRAARVLERCASLNPDVVLLDVEMPGTGGLEIARRLERQDPAPAVVFVTAHDRYALEAFGVAAVDYVVKPVRATRLRRALNRIAASGTGGSIAAHVGGRLVRVPLSEVRAFTVADKVTLLHAVDGCRVVDESLANLEQRFGDRFVRVHRSALASRRHIRAMYRDRDDVERVDVDGLAEGLEVSRRNRAAVRDLLTGGS